MNKSIIIDNISKSYAEVKAVRGISLEVNEGEMFGLVGPDGAGKTTTIRMLCGLLKPDDGSASILDMDLKKEKAGIKKQIGYLSQKFSLYGDLTVDENIEFFADIHGVRNFKERRTQLLEFTRLTSFRSRLADRLSGGMKQKLALACTLIHKPRIIFLDEPTTGVDPVSRRDFWKILSELQKEGITIFMSTPYLDEAERCNRVAMMNEGRIISLDTPQNIRNSLDKEIVEVVCTPARKAYRIVRERTEFEAQLFGDRLHIVVGDSTGDMKLLTNLFSDEDITVTGMRTVTPSLENVFIHLLSK
ncbi:MAG: ATP-binding cassette domain-containing protein [Bacteroidota bacterium]